MGALLAVLGAAAPDEGEDDIAFLWREYQAGRVHPDALARLQRPAHLDGNVQNTLVCLEVAAGRYREALAWGDVPVHGWWNDEGRRLVRLNLAEALACLGRLEDSLALLEGEDVDEGLVSAGVAAHRAWVLAELGRVDEARAELKRTRGHCAALGDFEAEWHFSDFVTELAGGDLDAASRALDDAARCAVRGSSVRNLCFLRGQLAVARGDDVGAVSCFETGARHPYRGQGGASLRAWGDALARLGREDEARAAWARGLVDDPQLVVRCLPSPRPSPQGEREHVVGVVVPE